MIIRTMAVAAVLAAGSMHVATASWMHQPRTGIVLVAGESVNSNITAELENAKRAIASRDMTLAAQALDRASAMAQGNSKMSAMVAHIAQTKQMLMAGDTTGASRMLDGVIHDVAQTGSGG